MLPTNSQRTLAMAATALWLAGAPAAEAVRPEKDTFSGPTAGAVFEGFQSDGCTSYYANVFATDDTNPRPERSTVFVSVNAYSCEEGELVNVAGFVDVAPAAFVADRQGRSATLAAKVEVYNYLTDAPEEVAVNVTWNAVGEPTRDRGTAISNGPEVAYFYHYTGTSAPARALGTLRIDGMAFGGTSSWAHLSRYSNTTMTRIKP